jgi:mono/diheme cytochrome c family protein
MRVSSVIATLSVSLVSAPGCMPTPSNPGASAPAAAAPAATPEAEASQIFAGRCTPCHGAGGAGDGVAAAALTPRPRNFHDATWQASVTDAHIESIIRLGGAAVGKSAVMPANPDLVAKPAVVAALRAMIRAMH